MKLIVAFIFIWIAVFCFYLGSSKKAATTRQSAFAWLVTWQPLSKWLASLSLLIALYIFAIYFGSSIALVALCILVTPLLFLFVLNVNDLKPKQKKAKTTT